MTDELSDKLKALIKEALIEAVRDPAFIAQLRWPTTYTASLLSHLSSAEWLRRQPGYDGLIAAVDRRELFVKLFATPLVPADGLILEFGVATGESINMLAALRPHCRVVGFDSFEGLPEPWHGHGAGSYTQGGAMPNVSANVELVKGWFDEVLPAWVEQHSRDLQNLRVLNVDCDIYSATKTVLDHVGPYLRPGVIVLFDEYYNYVNWEQHEHKAWLEYLDTRPDLSARLVAVAHSQVHLGFLLEARTGTV